MNLVERIKQKARADVKRIVLPEGDELHLEIRDAQTVVFKGFYLFILFRVCQWDA